MRICVMSVGIIMCVRKIIICRKIICRKIIIKIVVVDGESMMCDVM